MVIAQKGRRRAAKLLRRRRRAAKHAHEILHQEIRLAIRFPRRKARCPQCNASLYARRRA